ncbi:RHS repeat-associated core domain-containing protein [Acetanaerobacterium elongatum]|uniref:RHS repeat-associated core domain-containing protein n=1 Tax=Acetanaerobacterium elongatum TaxID=258515 RepID=A0A1G9WR48_9FIRM|nr:RHS repeat-associated core domain-containing protein [Acetanaerobacterium elongatum]SDM86625.1 RHS repeat-associated core domain-containing protein [Acetanaerobacterium elongatum]
MNGTEYYYIRNGQNDITGILDTSGSEVVSYSYDTWGKLLGITGSLADTVGVKNPYRGYRYDTETGLYYLNSRYYEPEIGRFINADDTNILGIDQDSLIQYNLFTYCLNNPTNMSDPSGYFTGIEEAAIAAFFIITGALVTFQTLITYFSSPSGIRSWSNFCLVLSTAFKSIYTKTIKYINEKIKAYQNRPMSQRIGTKSTDKNHILKGTKGKHIPGWKKFGFDPNGNNGWAKVLVIMKAVVDAYDKISSYTNKDGSGPA